MFSIREVIEKNPDTTLDLFTAIGCLMATPEVCANLLRQEPVNMNPDCPDCDWECPAEMVLNRQVLTLVVDKNNPKLLHIMTD